MKSKTEVNRDLVTNSINLVIVSVVAIVVMHWVFNTNSIKNINTKVVNNKNYVVEAGYEGENPAYTIKGKWISSDKNVILDIDLQDTHDKVRVTFRDKNSVEDTVGVYDWDTDVIKCDNGYELKVSPDKSKISVVKNDTTEIEFGKLA